MSITVEPVVSRRLQKQFTQLAWDLYRGDPCWVPPLRQNQRELLNFDPDPFYVKNEIQCFLALKDGKPVGRVAAIINNGHIERYKERRGFFGFFESINDQEVANALFDAARAWLKEHDILLVRGPTNPSLNHECGLLIEGFDSMPTFMMSYNAPYYADLIEGYGFRKVEDLYAFWGDLAMLESLDPKLKFIVDEAKRRFQPVLRPINKSRFAEEVRMFLDIYNKSLVATWGFVPLSDAEVDHMAKGLKQLVVPELTTICEIEGKPVGAVFGLLDYNPRIKKIDGRLFPFGFLRLLWNRKKIHRVRLMSTNILPEFQRWGIGLVLLERLIPDSLKFGIQEAEFSWVLESNHLSRATLERGGAKKVKSFRIYDYAPTEPAAAEKG
ncbi:N-acetyltransferase [Blastopirellula sp. J2-11]|uniref:N-acetyltransferase n=1 Tax=Blastopirellula sp. J2-11 TaxID=2943192 RepID=UPI0021CA4D0A|nr:N-acetyltransferase [Blastopirellula sp. J2-11]UUO06286.1 N-acetyltransferase [Blastopirellula sp. J2-11]